MSASNSNILGIDGSGQFWYCCITGMELLSCNKTFSPLLMKIQIACKKFCGIFWITERCTTISRLHMLKVWRKNFEISVKLSFSATSLFTRAMWGGRSCSSAVVPLVGSCFALQQSWIIFSVPSQCYILFHFTLNLATFITLHSTAASN